MSKISAAVSATRAVGRTIRANPLKTSIAATAVLALLDSFEETGLFAERIPLSKHIYRVDRAGLEAAVKALEEGNRRAIADAAAKVLVPNMVERVSADGKKSVGHQRTGDMQTSFAPLTMVTPSVWPLTEMVNGALVIVGESRSGKTTYIRNLAPDLLIRISEPLEIVDTQDNVVVLSDFVHAIGLAIAATLSGLRVAIDSLRGVMYRLEGNTMEGGVSAGLFEILTTLNNVAASVDGTIIFAVNPMTGDESKLNTLLSRLEASVSGLIFMKSGAVARTVYRTVDGDRHASDDDRIEHTSAVPVPNGYQDSPSGALRFAEADFGPERTASKDIAAPQVVASDPVVLPGPRRLPTLKFND